MFERLLVRLGLIRQRQQLNYDALGEVVISEWKKGNYGGVWTVSHLLPTQQPPSAAGE
jgi:hypothetical protein